MNKKRFNELSQIAALMRRTANEVAESAEKSLLVLGPNGELATRSGKQKRRIIVEPMGVRGQYDFELRSRAGRLKRRWAVKNLVVNAGLNWIREYAFDSVTPTTLARMRCIGIGTGTTAVAATDTDLQTALIKQDFTAATGYVAGGTGVVTVLTTFAAGVGTGAVAEAGVFNNTTLATGQMWNRVTFAAVNKAAGDTLKVTVTITFTAS